MDLKEYRKKLVGNEQERAVSPVIGVILMVAITVILAAVIAAFVLDMGSSISSEAQAGANIDVDDAERNIQSSWTSQGNSDRINVTVAYTAYNDTDGATPSDEDGQVSVEFTDVGNSESWSWNDLDDELTMSGADIDRIEGTITATATIDGGSSTVITDSNFDFTAPSDD